jgi:arsenate reductase (glutaredoxin)
VAYLGVSPEEIVRKGEPEYKENFKGKTLNDEQWIKALIDYPKLMERPIVVKNKKAVVGRPPENVLRLL